jgi:hypothetical protein
MKTFNKNATLALHQARAQNDYPRARSISDSGQTNAFSDRRYRSIEARAEGHPASWNTRVLEYL